MENLGTEGNHLQRLSDDIIFYKIILNLGEWAIPFRITSRRIYMCFLGFSSDYNIYKYIHNTTNDLIPKRLSLEVELNHESLPSRYTLDRIKYTKKTQKKIQCLFKGSYEPNPKSETKHSPISSSPRSDHKIFCADERKKPIFINQTDSVYVSTQEL
jgi:hypothetical protein